MYLSTFMSHTHSKQLKARADKFLFSAWRRNR